MPLQFGVINEPLPVVIIPNGTTIYYSWDLKTWWTRIIGISAGNVAYDSASGKFATAPNSFPAAPNFIRIATGTGVISLPASAWAGIGSGTGPSTPPSTHYANEQWFLCETRYIHKYPVNGAAGARYSVATGIILSSVVYDSVTSRYIIGGGINNYYTTDFSSFTSIANGFPSTSTTNGLCVGSAGRIVTVGETAGVGRISTSDNGGSTWTARTLTPPAGISAYRALSVVYVSQLGMYFVGCQSGLVYSSPDAITWTHRATLTNTAQIHTIGYSQKLGKVFAVGTASSTLNVVESTNGTTWVNSDHVRNDNWVWSGGTLAKRGAITR